MSKKVVLGFSGGLDTSYCVKYLTEEKGYEVYTIIINTGGFSKNELNSLREKALQLGAKAHKEIDASEVYYDQTIRYLVYGNILKNGTYPLSVSSERMVQAKEIAKYAQEIKADAVAHGSTGAGNDQVRFDMTFHILCPDLEIITPIRDMQLSREEEINYLRSKDVEMDFAKAQYSINKGIWGTSVGGKETLTSAEFLPDEAFPTRVTKNAEERINLSFEKGELKAVNEQHFAHPVEAIKYLQEIAGPFGIGRDIHVGDTIIGIKGRVGFEAAAPVVIIKAHHALEKHVLTKWQLMWKDQLSNFYGNWLHEGQTLDPVMRDIEAFLESSQQQVTGKVFVSLYPYHFQVRGIQSDHDLMNNEVAQYGEMNMGWTGEDVRGFSKIFANQSVIWHKVNKQQSNEG